MLSLPEAQVSKSRGIQGRWDLLGKWGEPINVAPTVARTGAIIV